jgi:hypothetical protein
MRAVRAMIADLMLQLTFLNAKLSTLQQHTDAGCQATGPFLVSNLFEIRYELLPLSAGRLI